MVELVAILEERQVKNGSVRVALQRHFKRSGWTDWPATGEAWCAHFEEHPLG